MRRTLAIAAIVVAMLGAIGLGAGVLHAMAGATRIAWVVTANQPAGATLDASTIHQVNLPAGGDSLAVVSASPVGSQLAHAMTSGDVVRSDDLVTSSLVQVPVTFKLAPGLAANDVVDIYAAGAATSNSAVNAVEGIRLIARNVTVVAVGTPSVIEVPAAQEPLWISLASSSVTLIAARSSGINVPASGHAYTGSEALDLLAGLAAGGSSASAPPSTTPPASPTGTP